MDESSLRRTAHATHEAEQPKQSQVDGQAEDELVSTGTASSERDA
jgi:hypothetical protein